MASHGTKVLRLGHPARLVSGVLRYSLDSIMTSCDGAEIVQDVRKEMTLALVSCMTTVIIFNMFFSQKWVELKMQLKNTSGEQKLKH